MAKPFPFTKKKLSNDFVKLTNEWISRHQDSNDDFDKERVKIKQLYLKNRDSLMKNNRGYYVFVSQDRFVATNLTVVDRKNKSPIKDTWGIWFKVGDEFGPTTNSLFSSVARGNACLPMSFGERGNNNLWFENKILVDTGCDTTTFDISVLSTIKNIYPNFPTFNSTTNVIGGLISLESGNIDIDFCGKEYSINVNFAKIPHVALIGMDLINDGNLFYDPNKWISFTRHDFS